jgi:hypothetical protein
MVMSSIIFAQRYVDGRSLLCYLSNGYLNAPGRLPTPLITHGKRAAKMSGKVVACCAL